MFFLDRHLLYEGSDAGLTSLGMKPSPRHPRIIAFSAID